jgi:hypothetical protein
MNAVRTNHAVYPVAFDNAGYTPTEGQVRQTIAATAAKSGNDGLLNTDPMMKRSSDSAWMLEYWDLTDTIVDGINALRLAADRYLPRFTDEDRADYEFRLKCTKVTNIYRDTVEGLASKPFEQEVALHVDESKMVPQPLLDFIENVDGSGNNLTVFSGATFFNGINSAIDWIFVDYSKPNPNVRSVADQKRVGARPYWSHVLGRNVLDPRSTIINGEEVLTYIKIYEPGSPDRIREFERLDSGTVVWRLYEKSDRPGPDGKTMFVLLPGGDGGGVITIGVIPMVPFITGRRDGRTWRFFPAMRDAADLQIELYQQESALKFVKILAAYPMLAGNGVKPIMEADGKTVKKIAVGPGRVLYAPPGGDGSSGSWAFVEPSATTMKFLADDVKDTMAQLRELGRQPLTVANVTVINSARGANKSKSAVKAWALGLKDALENAMVITCKWLAIPDTTYSPVVNVFMEFDEFLEGKDLDTLQAARAAKDISQLTYWEELQRRAVLSPEFDADNETERLLNELPGDGEDNSNIDDTTGLPILPSDSRYVPPGVPPKPKDKP